MRSYGIAGAYDQDNQVHRFTVERGKIQPVLDGGGSHAHAVHAVNLGVGYGQSTTDTGGTALFASPYGIKDFIAVVQFVGTAKRIHEFVQDFFLGRNAIVDKPFGKAHNDFLFEYLYRYLVKKMPFGRKMALMNEKNIKKP